MKFKTVQIHFLSDVVIQKFCYHGNMTSQLFLSISLSFFSETDILRFSSNFKIYGF